MAQASEQGRPPRLPSLDIDYRLFLRENDADDSSTGEDDLVAEPSDTSLSGSDAPPGVDVIGVSISRAQTFMRSSETPAVQKAHPLGISRSYLGDEPIGETADGSPSKTSIPSIPMAFRPASFTVSPPNESLAPSSPRLPFIQQPRRSSMMRSILGETDANHKRSLSGPTVLGALRNMLPDLPSLPGLRTNATPPTPELNLVAYAEGRPRSQPTDLVQTGQGYPKDRRLRQTRGHLTATYQPTSPSALSLDGNAEWLLSPTSPQSNRSLARSNSESSLYLRRKGTGASAFDDTTPFADVTRINNARFKAITDSFQNSTLRLPRLPVLKYYAQANIQDVCSTDDLTRQDTQANAGASTWGNTNYTTIRNIRQSKRPIEVENPQQRPYPILSEALAKTTGDLVILGGYRGSILRDAKPPHRQLWAPVKIGLNLRSVDLEVGLTREDEECAYQKVFPSGVLSHIGPIDICRRLLKHARKCTNARHGKLRVHDWGYDWRLSPDLLGQRLIRFLERLECNDPETPPERRGATVIAHSVGGLITRWAVNQRPELFAGVIYAGVPQHCVNILGPLRNGDDVLLSSKVLTAQVNFTMRTTYVMLPENGRCFINKYTNERYDLNFFEPNTWDEYCLSPCINPALPPIVKGHRKSIVGSFSESIASSLPSMASVTIRRGSWFGGNPNASSSTQNERNADEPSSNASPYHLPPLTGESTIEPTMKTDSSSSSGKSSIATACTIPLPQAREYLARTLSEILAFKHALAHNRTLQSQNRYPPHALLFGKSVPTVYGARVLSREHIKYTDAYDDLAFAAGDGVVLASAAQLPEGYRSVKGGRVQSDRGHVGLLGDLEGVGKCLLAVVEGRERGVGRGCY